ncbi:nucleotide pyrophosphohydrolase [Mollicutes bacterium LVI A0039]|nr:nucleotide pyrophosphohydrolase [Mollicutes bacterium LVI A0039]
MKDLNFKQMQEFQKQLQDQYQDKWPALTPDKGKEKLLWMLIEAGEIADILKKKGDKLVMEDPTVRNEFIEEMCDTLMYFNTVMLCYDITPEELQEVYVKKHLTNMQRW